MKFQKPKYLWEYAPTKRNFGINASEVKELQFELKHLIETLHQYNWNYLSNVQSLFMKIERQIIEDHKHKYPKYLKLKEKQVERDRYVKEAEEKIKSLKLCIEELFN